MAWRGLLNDVEIAAEDSGAIDSGRALPALQADGLTQLLQRPSGTWMGGDVAMDQAPAVVLDHDKHVQQTKGRGYGSEEIAGNNPLSMQAQEGRPA
jgi:hypothetical protein